MPKSKPSTLSGILDTDMEEDTLSADAFLTPDSNQENTEAAKKKPPKQKANAKRFTKPKRLSGGSATKSSTSVPKSKPGRKRAPLKEQADKKRNEDIEEVDDFVLPTNIEKSNGISVKPKATAKRKAGEIKEDRPAKARATGRVDAVKDGEFEYTPTAIRQITLKKEATNGKGNDIQRQASVEVGKEIVIPETQGSPEVDPLVTQEELMEENLKMPQSVLRKNAQLQPKSRQRQPSVARRRAGSASDTERVAGDPTLRRKLGEITRKFENVDLRYRNLKNSRVTEAEANYERLKKQSEIQAQAASDLIDSLKKEIATQKAIAVESQTFRNQVQLRDTELAKAQSFANQLSASLVEAQNENKILQAKLANSRSASVAVESLGSRTPGSAMKARNQAQTRSITVGSAEAAQAAQVAQLKEDLYGDLTGLILRGVYISSEADTYDCIQTGCNGTLHFKLAIAKDADDSYEDTEFQFTPRLDVDRDRDMISLLPEYLTDPDGITFSRMNAALFYGRLVETLTKKKRLDEEH